MPLDDTNQLSVWDRPHWSQAPKLTDDVLPDVRGMCQRRMSSRAMAQRLGVSHVTMQKFLRRHGLSQAKSGPETWARGRRKAAPAFAGTALESD